MDLYAYEQLKTQMDDLEEKLDLIMDKLGISESDELEEDKREEDF